MSDKKRPHLRRVVTGMNPAGKSTISDDSPCKALVATPMFDVVDIWRMGPLPGPVGAPDTSTGEVVLEPPLGGLLVRQVTFYPDTSWQNASEYKDALSAIKGAESHSDDETVGMHVTNTVDIAYVVSGEIVAMLQTKETVLRTGDSLIQRGTLHAWSNRTDKPAVVIFTQVSAKH